MGNSGGDNRVEFGTRLSHSVWYESPNWSGLQFNVLFSPGQTRNNDSSNIPQGEPDCSGGNDPTSGGNTLISCSDGAFNNAVSAYVGVIQAQELLALDVNNEQVLAKQLEATNDRFRVGEITRTDVSLSESRFSRATADKITAPDGNEVVLRGWDWGNQEAIKDADSFFDASPLPETGFVAVVDVRRRPWTNDLL